MLELQDNSKWKVLYDGDCGFCTNLVHRLGKLLDPERFETLPLQTPWVVKQLAMPQEELLADVKVLTPNGQLYRGVDGLLMLAKQIWWARPVYLLAFLPSIKPLLKWAYTQFAKRRYCVSGACSLPTQQ